MDRKASLLVLCFCIAGISFSAGKPVSSMSKISLKYDAVSNTFTTEEMGPGSFIAEAQFHNLINKTGWSFLKVRTMEGYPDYLQAYGAGLVEGWVTQNVTAMHWINTMAGMCPRPYSQFCSRLAAFLTANLRWMKAQIQQHKDKGVHLPYWHQVELFLYQAAGLADGLKGLSKSPNTDIDPMGFYLFQVDGDIDDLRSVLGDPDFRRPLGPGHCSALVKLLPGNKDLYVSQDTWDDYPAMLRILKLYDFPWKTTANGSERIPGFIQGFSSYPGTLMSGDDFYILSSGLASMETTIGNNNASLWKFVTPNSMLEGVRSVVANRLAGTGAEWATIFSQFNSGTYNNEWMVVDYKRFQSGMKSLLPGLLTVLDQIPGTIKWADLTNLLSGQGYFPSYNVAYFPEIFNLSGNQPLVKKYGDWFTYDKTPRALIFKRDHVKVKDVKSMIRLMRYNDFQHDPLSRCNCTPPYSAENAISARSDLNPKDGKYPFGSLGHRIHGGIDMKMTSSSLIRFMSFVAVGGPTWDQQPPFQWSTSDFKNVSHIGQPDKWTFQPLVFAPESMFGRG